MIFATIELKPNVSEETTVRDLTLSYFMSEVITNPFSKSGQVTPFAVTSASEFQSSCSFT